MTQMVMLTPVSGGVERLLSTPTESAFSENTMEFVQALSELLLAKGSGYKFPELIALGFWLRKSNIKRFQQGVKGMCKPLGTVVHFTPANVDTMFVYSWVCSLLMGNKNVIRLASQPSEVRDELLLVLNSLMSKTEFTEIANRNAFVQFDKESEHTARLSTQADGRVIWGGDDSVNAIRRFETKPRCRDITFADRYSASVINGTNITDDQLDTLAGLLWRDIEPYDQQACSSPKVLFWLGERDNLVSLINKMDALPEPQVLISQRNEQLVGTQLIQSSGAVTNTTALQHFTVLELSHFDEALLQWQQAANMLSVIPVDSIEVIGGQISSKLQTLSHWGIAEGELLKLVNNPSINGIDRVVPVGQALDFDTVWDGYELFSQLSRQVQFIP